MDVYEFTHHGELVNLNEAVGMAKHSPFTYSSMKKKADEAIRRSIQRDLPMVRLGEQPFLLVCTWFMKATEKSGYVKMDPDNVATAVKYVLDAMQPKYEYVKVPGQKKKRKVLVATGIIDNDNFATLSGGIIHRFKKSPDGEMHAKFALVMGGDINLPGIADSETDKQLF